MSRILLTLLVFAGVALTACAQTDLRPMSTRSTNIPAFSFMGPAQCDVLDDMFFLVEGNPSAQGDWAILRLDRSVVPFVYDVPESQNANVIRYYVDPQSGVLSALTQTGTRTTLTMFDRSGNQPTNTVVNVPAGLMVDAIAVDSTVLLISGFFDARAAKLEQMTTFVGLFDAKTGQLRTRVSSLSGRRVTSDDLHRPRDMAAVADGPHFYVATFGTVARIDSNGTMQQILLPRPAAATVVTGISRSGEGLAFDLMTPHAKNAPAQPLEFAVVDPVAMHVTRRLRSSAEMGNLLVCAKDPYVFVKSVNGKLKFITATAR